MGSLQLIGIVRAGLSGDRPFDLYGALEHTPCATGPISLALAQVSSEVQRKRSDFGSRRLYGRD